MSCAKEIVSLSWPVMASRLSIMVMGLVDTIVLGHYATRELGFHGIAWATFSIFFLTATGLVMGIQIKTAHAFGAQDNIKIGHSFKRGMIYALSLGVGSGGLLGLVALWLLPLMVNPSLSDGALPTLMVHASSLPIVVAGMAASQFFEALGKTRALLWANIAANLCNAGLVLVLVDGRFGVEGAQACALATMIARLILLIVILSLIIAYGRKHAIKLWPKEALNDEKTQARDQRKIGYATGASYFIEVTAFSSMTFFAAQINEATVAAWVIILNFASLVFMVPLGLSTGASVLVGRAFGQKNTELVRRTGLVGFMIAVILMSIISLLTLGFSTPIAHLYTKDVALIAPLSLGLMLSASFFIPDGLQVVAAQALRARGDVFWPTFIHYVSYGVIMLPLGFVLAIYFDLKLTGLILACVIASWVSGPVLITRFWSLKR